MRIAAVLPLLGILAFVNRPTAGQIAPTPQPCATPPAVSVEALRPKSLTPLELQQAKGPQLLAAPPVSIGPPPCTGFTPTAASTASDRVLMDDATQDIVQDSLRAGVSSAAGLPPEIPTNTTLSAVATASKGLSGAFDSPSLTTLLSDTVPQLLNSPWTTGGVGVLLNSSSTQSQEQNQVGSVQLVYERALDAVRQIQKLKEAPATGNSVNAVLLRQSCARLREALVGSSPSLTYVQTTEADQVLFACDELVAKAFSESGISRPSSPPVSSVKQTRIPMNGNNDCPKGACVCR